MNSWQSKCDFGIVHGLAFLACRAGEGPILETLQQIVNDTAFGAVEIAPPKDPAVRAKARDLLAASQLQVVYLPILPIIIEGLGIADEDAGKRKAAIDKLKSLLDEAIESYWRGRRRWRFSRLGAVSIRGLRLFRSSSPLRASAPGCGSASPA